MKDYSGEHWKVAGTAVTFGKFYKGSIERLEAAGCEVKLNPYGRPLTNEEMIEFAGDCDAVIVGNDKVPANVIEHFHNMKIIAKHGVGVDAIDKDQAKKQGILVTNAPGTNKDEVADAAMCLALMVARDFHTMNTHTKNHEWIKYPGVDVVDKTIGVIGAGAIGTAFVRRATASRTRFWLMTWWSVTRSRPWALSLSARRKSTPTATSSPFTSRLMRARSTSLTRRPFRS